MRRSPALTRRHFCALSAAGAVAACSDGVLPIQTGGLGGTGGDDQQPDASQANPPDAGSGSGSNPDASVGTCSGTETDVGAPSSFTTGNPIYFSSNKFFVVRDAQGLYALTARCTHEGATCVVQSGEFFCPRHGAEFTFTGAIIAGPVSSPLKHYAMCTLANGHVAVNTGMTVSASTRLNA
jgi:cytochrome b6-f complex iron-sulfur subunit